MDIKNKVIVITGGASGLGAATAQRFTASGAKVMLAHYFGNRAQACCLTAHDGNDVSPHPSGDGSRLCLMKKLLLNL